MSHETSKSKFVPDTQEHHCWKMFEIPLHESKLNLIVLCQDLA